ncbi:hypothetical protein BD324DRAFT_391291 [Kockovaella imperatae]|uniref:Uncharacterized protein n=1 Tax=Kockovaella imperatae TaxID=4999 RepID=A0A1Y1UKM2_9TREE|nr:hypothetical protein BD324DRAFT_391291 [Kockovaella imperatae]ORX37685.1 hypothetical protein BD324DRAFT_391291 [Kockovaella imperatae]
MTNHKQDVGICCIQASGNAARRKGPGVSNVLMSKPETIVSETPERASTETDHRALLAHASRQVRLTASTDNLTDDLTFFQALLMLYPISPNTKKAAIGSAHSVAYRLSSALDQAILSVSPLLSRRNHSGVLHDLGRLLRLFITAQEAQKHNLLTFGGGMRSTATN